MSSDTVSDERLADILELDSYRMYQSVLPMELSSMLAELQSLRSKPVAGVEVRPLEWSKLYTDGNGYSATDARCVVGLYSAFQLSGDTAWVLEFGNVRLGDFDSLDQAQAAALSDYRQRILSTLSCSEQEPVAWARYAEDGDLLELLHDKERVGSLMSFGKDVRPLYASPQPEAVITEEMARLKTLVERAFKDGLAYAGNVRNPDPDVAWGHSAVRQALSEAEQT